MMEIDRSITKNYSNIFYSFFSEERSVCHEKVTTHFFMYVVSGLVVIHAGADEYQIKKGQCVFVPRDHTVSLSKYLDNGEPFKSITLNFDRNYLRKIYNSKDVKLDKTLSYNGSESNDVILRLPESPYIDSLFLSMLPFFERDIEPSDELIKSKMLEGISFLIDAKQDLVPILFDFSDPWKIDIFDFLNENYKEDLSMEEIANYTGRSLATFKRDFAKISNLTPRKWLIEKRLTVAYEEIVYEGKKVNDVYCDVGFKSRSHFSVLFKEKYGFSPNYCTKRDFAHS